MISQALFIVEIMKLTQQLEMFWECGDQGDIYAQLRKHPFSLILKIFFYTHVNLFQENLFLDLFWDFFSFMGPKNTLFQAGINEYKEKRLFYVGPINFLPISIKLEYIETPKIDKSMPPNAQAKFKAQIGACSRLGFRRLLGTTYEYAFHLYVPHQVNSK
jgi:hypothetical protein